MGKSLVLLVEDNPDDEELTLRAFRKHNLRCHVVVARDGQEALDYLFGEGEYAGRDIAVQPQLVLLDIQLPKRSGLEVLKIIRSDERTRRIPVVLLTSSAEQVDLIAGYDHGANSYVCKPVDYNEFLEAAQQLGVYWLKINQIP